MRGYLIGSGWKDYRATGAVCGIALPEGLRMAEKLPEPIFTPAAKAELGEHDENISFEQVVAMIGAPLAERIGMYEYMREMQLLAFREQIGRASCRERV